MTPPAPTAATDDQFAKQLSQDFAEPPMFASVLDVKNDSSTTHSDWEIVLAVKEGLSELLGHHFRVDAIGQKWLLVRWGELTIKLYLDDAGRFELASFIRPDEKEFMFREGKHIDMADPKAFETLVKRIKFVFHRYANAYANTPPVNQLE